MLVRLFCCCICLLPEPQRHSYPWIEYATVNLLFNQNTDSANIALDEYADYFINDPEQSFTTLWQALIHWENFYIYAVEWYDKSNDYNFVYKNNEVKPENPGMTGAWVSVGIEWCVLHHHRASTFLLMVYTTMKNA